MLEKFSKGEIPDNNDRLGVVDIARGLGIVLVVCSHTVYLQLMSFAYPFFIPLFFVISGYTMHNLSIRKKAIRLLKPYLFFNLGIVLMTYVSGLRDVSWRHLFGIVYSRYSLFPLEIGTTNYEFMNVGNSPTWFLTCMFVTFVLCNIIIRLKKYRICILGGYLVVTSFLDKIPILLPWSIDIAFLMAIFMYGGSLLRKSKLLEISNINIIGLCLVYCMLAYFIGECNLSVRNYGNSILLLLLGGFLGSFLIFKLSYFLEGSCLDRPLRAIGKHSLVIFCIQIPLLFMVQQVFLSFTLMIFHNKINQLLCLSIVQLFLTLIVGYFISRFINKFFLFMIK